MKPEDLADSPPARLPFPVTRASSEPVEFRSEDEGREMLRGRFTTFDDPYEVHSAIEGHFIERMAPGAFDRTVVESRKNIKVLFNHGQDPTMGDQILGDIVDLRGSADYAVAPFEGIPPLIVSGLRKGAYGASHRFSVISDEWDYRPERSASNPDAIPERLITEARLYEFGPVTFPANPNATAGIRSTTDDFYERGTDIYESVLRSAQAARAPRGADAETEGSPQTDAGLPPSPEPDAQRAEPPPEVPATTDQDPPDGGSSVSRSKHVEFTNREDMSSRASELEEALKRQAEAFPGVLPTDEEARYKADKEELVDLQKNIDAWDSRQADLESLVRGGKVEAPKPYTPVTGVNQIVRKSEKDIYSLETRATSYDGRQQELRDDAMRINEITRYPQIADEARTKDRVADLLDNHDSENKELARRMKLTGSPAYLRAFEKIVKGRGQLMALTPEEQRGTALAVGVDGTGGFSVPFAFDPTVIAIGAWSGAVNPYRRVARVVPIVGTDTWNALTATAVVATRTTEAAASIEQGPTFAQPQYIVKRVQGQITASFEMFQDRSDLASEMAVLIQEAKDNEEETSFATGAGAGSASIGVGPVNGTSGAYTSITTATSVTLAAADFDAVEAALPVRHRFGAQWFFNRLNIRKAQTLETAGGKLFGGQQYQSVGVPEIDRAGNTGLRLLGYAVNESPSLPTAATANIVIGTLLAPNSYVIVERIGMSIQFIPFITNSSSLATGQQALYFMYRNHAAPINVDAGRTLRFLT